jgi:hypothetical protein
MHLTYYILNKKKSSLKKIDTGDPRWRRVNNFDTLPNLCVYIYIYMCVCVCVIGLYPLYDGYIHYIMDIYIYFIYTCISIQSPFTIYFITNDGNTLYGPLG